MQENDIKEELSISFINTLASYEKIKVARLPNDDGVDLQIGRVIKYTDPNGRASLVDDGKYVHVQLKATTLSGVNDDGETIKYSLKGKNFNDLVVRRAESNSPLVLILFILPNNSGDWVAVDVDKILMKGSAYWYYPPEGLSVINKDSSKTIVIPKSNQIRQTFFETIFDEDKPIWK